jgi:hypothetical protein
VHTPYAAGFPFFSTPNPFELCMFVSPPTPFLTSPKSSSLQPRFFSKHHQRWKSNGRSFRSAYDLGSKMANLKVLNRMKNCVCVSLHTRAGIVWSLPLPRSSAALLCVK